MKALVTGAAGFVGRHLCPKLEAAGYAIAKVDPREPPSLERIATSVESYTQLQTKYGPRPETFDLIVHLAANIVNVDARMKGGMAMYDDIELDLAMCRWLEKNPPKQCAVLMSSCAVDYPSDPYCIVKRNLESFAQTLHKKGVPVIVLRPFSGYGEDQSVEYPFRAILERALRKENPLTVWGGEQVRDWIHIDDLTDAILFAIQAVKPCPTPIEVGTRRRTSLVHLARMMAEAAGYNPEIFHDESKPASSLRRVAGEQGNALLQAWGWQPMIELEVGIHRAVTSRKKQEASCPA
jgi:nucleoside-diphosphate-sugar epimerase